MRRPAFELALLALLPATAVLVAAPAHANPHSAVTRLEASLGSAGTFTDKSVLADTTVNMVVDPASPLWSRKDGKLVVPSCSVTLSGTLTLFVSAYQQHDTSVVHWTLSGLGGVDWPISYSHGPDATQLGDGDFERTWGLNIPVAPGKSSYHLQAWTSKKGVKSSIKTILWVFNCEEAPKPAPITIKAPLRLQGVQPKTLKPSAAATLSASLSAALDIRSLRVDLGLADANALEWLQGQAPQKEVLFHEVAGAAFEPGGAQFGVTQSVTVDGTPHSSHAIDSCDSALRVQRYLVRARNTGYKYAGSSAKDVRVALESATDDFASSGSLGPVAQNVEGTATLQVANQGIVLLSSGSYTVRADLLPPAASATPEHNTASVSITLRCKRLSATSWQ